MMEVKNLKVGDIVSLPETVAPNARYRVESIDEDGGVWLRALHNDRLYGVPGDKQAIVHEGK